MFKALTIRNNTSTEEGALVTSQQTHLPCSFSKAVEY